MKVGLCVKEKNGVCISLMKMSPLTAVLKCPHYERGYYASSISLRGTTLPLAGPSGMGSIKLREGRVSC